MGQLKKCQCGNNYPVEVAACTHCGGSNDGVAEAAADRGQPSLSGAAADSKQESSEAFATAAMAGSSSGESAPARTVGSEHDPSGPQSPAATEVPASTDEAEEPTFLILGGTMEPARKSGVLQAPRPEAVSTDPLTGNDIETLRARVVNHLVFGCVACILIGTTAAQIVMLRSKTGAKADKGPVVADRPPLASVPNSTDAQGGPVGSEPRENVFTTVPPPARPNSDSPVPKAPVESPIAPEPGAGPNPQTEPPEHEKWVTVPDLVGKRIARARQEAARSGLRLKELPRTYDTLPRGSIVTQEPSAAARVAKRTAIWVTVSRGVPPPLLAAAPEPRPRAYPEGDAVSQTAGSGAPRDNPAPGRTPRGTRTGQEPRYNPGPKQGSTPRVTRSSGPPSSSAANGWRVPNLTGKTLQEAGKAARSRGFKLAVRQPVSSPTPKGRVFAQTPPAGVLRSRPKQLVIAVTLSRGPDKPLDKVKPVTHAEIEGDAAPLMMRALRGYLALEADSLRGRGWSYLDIARAGYLVRHSRPRLTATEVIRRYDAQRDWAAVAASLRIDLPEGEAALRLVLQEHYPPTSGRVVDAEGRGWTLGDVLVAGNLNVRFQRPWEEIVRWRSQGLEWSAIAGRVGVPAEDLFQP